MFFYFDFLIIWLNNIFKFYLEFIESFMEDLFIIDRLNFDRFDICRLL